MGEFSARWLRLREPVDQRSRNKVIEAALRETFATRRGFKVVDIGCGTGANLRATARLLSSEQDWTLIDNDNELLNRARDALRGWADTAASSRRGLILTKDGKTIVVRFRHADVAQNIDGALGDAVDLVTASAVFDLVSRSFIERFVTAVVQRGAALHAVLTYNGLQSWSPPSAEDERICQAFNVHQEGDKGFGAASGARGAEFLASACRAAGYRTEVGDSPWRIGRDDNALMRELTDGVADAVAETGLIDTATIAAWRARPRSGVVVGHSDILAVPA